METNNEIINSRETTIPFMGFYDSLHDSNLDNALEQIISHTEYGEDLYNLSVRGYAAVNWTKVFIAYSRLYVETFTERFSIKLEFKLLESPREYNFSTDVIICSISPEEISRIFTLTDKKILTDIAKEKFTSRSGFISFYSPDWQNWGNLEDWESVQLGVLIEAYIQSQDDWAGNWEEDIMESCICNGNFSNILWENQREGKLERLCKIRDYLQGREARQARQAKE